MGHSLDRVRGGDCGRDPRDHIRRGHLSAMGDDYYNCTFDNVVNLKNKSLTLRIIKNFPLEGGTL
jgi:hypothetical protein